MIDVTQPQSLLDALGKLHPDSSIDELREIITEDCVVVEPDSLPYGGKYHGPEGMRDVVRAVFDAWQDFTSDIEQIVSDNVETMVLYTVISGRTAKGTFSFPHMERYKVRDGKIAGLTLFYFDTGALAKLAG